MATVATSSQAEAVPFYHAANRTEMVRVGMAGLLVGILIPLVGFLLSQYVINPVFCQAANAGGICDNSSLVGYYVASVLVTAAVIPILIGWGIFRALLLGVGATIALWGLQKYVDPLTVSNWLEYYAYSAVLFGLTYVLFYWMLRLRNFGLSIVLSVVVVLLVRWALLT